MATPVNPARVIDPGSPFGVELRAARAAWEAGEVGHADDRYLRAARLAPDADLRVAVAVEHVTRLRERDSTLALAQCRCHLQVDGDAIRLLLVHAETRLIHGDYSSIDAELEGIRDLLAAGRTPDPAGAALLLRLEGLAAARRGARKGAEKHLRAAAAAFRALGDRPAAEVVDADLRDLALRSGDAGGPVPEAGPLEPPRGLLARSEHLRAQGRFEEALAPLDVALADPTLDPALRFPFLDARVRLLRQLHQHSEAEHALTALYEATAQTAQRDENRRLAQRHDPRNAGDLAPPKARELRLHHVRRLVHAGRLDDAEHLLLAERAAPEPDDRHEAEWQLAAGELTLAIAERDRSPEVAERAIAHLQRSADAARDLPLIVLRISALRLVGRANVLCARMDDAADAWAQAHNLEEQLAARQPSDSVRIRMLQGASDEFDERIAAAVRAYERGDRHDVVGVVVAIEAARGAAMLPRILPVGDPRLRELPAPGDTNGARRWLRRELRRMPRDQAVWMMHATPDQVHHVLLTRRTMRYESVNCPRGEVIAAIDAMAGHWESGVALDVAVRSGAFDRSLSEVACRIGIGLLDALPETVQRVAVVAGGELAEVPLALMPCPGSDDDRPLGLRYALSDLPCLAVRRPLRRRARTQRGMSMLLVQPAGLTPASPVPGRVVQTGEQATPEALRDALSSGRFREVRIDAHASHRTEVLELASSSGGSGVVKPEDLESMNLAGTGTLLLGACETGMSTRIGRDERTGYVRAALLAGSSAVLAARWEAWDPAAARVLDAFERHLHQHPRDVALLHAVREEDARDRSADPPTAVAATASHPVRWAAWTLYGDPGHQTAHGPVRRWVRRLRAGDGADR